MAIFEALVCGIRICRSLSSDKKVGRTDLEQKSLADEREAYKGTLSEETRIK